MSDSILMFSLMGIMLFLALIIPPIQNEIMGTSTTYNIDGIESELGQTDQNLTSWDNLSVFDSIFNMFFWTYTGLGIVFNSILILFKLTFWVLIARIIRGV